MPNTIVKIVSIKPAITNVCGVPMNSAISPNGNADSGINPHDIINILITLPLFSGSAYIWEIDMFNDI